MADEPDQAPDRYRRQSPLSHVQAIDAPVLLLQGEADQRCPLGQAEELFARLVRIGHAEARMVIFPGGTHHVSSTGRPSHREAFYRHLADWVSERSRSSDKPDTAYAVSEAEGVKSKDRTKSRQSPTTMREAAK
ncbi:alpha/beta hydrolase family protein [Lysobacter yananisis]|uniref:alpha/beta hydrolase family protein n=1 Tax=Lysobacter yananisis TaxID=1003114 RepID=UPI003CE4485E